MNNIIDDLKFCSLVLLWYRNRMLDEIDTSVNYIDDPEWREKNIEYFEKEIEKALTTYDRLIEYIDSLRK